MWLSAVTAVASMTVVDQNRGSIFNGGNGTRTVVATVVPDREFNASTSQECKTGSRTGKWQWVVGTRFTATTMPVALIFLHLTSNLCPATFFGTAF